VLWFKAKHFIFQIIGRIGMNDFGALFNFTSSSFSFSFSIWRRSGTLVNSQTDALPNRRKNIIERLRIRVNFPFAKAALSLSYLFPLRRLGGSFLNFGPRSPCYYSLNHLLFPFRLNCYYAKSHKGLTAFSLILLLLLLEKKEKERCFGSKPNILSSKSSAGND